MIEEDEARLREAAELVREINMGATAIGTGITAHPDYARRVCEELSRITGIALVTAPNLDEGDAGLRRLRPDLGRAQARGGQAVEDLQRLAIAVLRAARGSAKWHFASHLNDRDAADTVSSTVTGD